MKTQLTETEGGLPSQISAEYHNVDQDITSFAILIINDPELQKNAFKIRVTFNENLATKEVSGDKKGIIIFNERDKERTSGIQSITVLDEKGKIIFNG